ncbi:MAG: hypothetical protein RMJ51_00370 [Candidatus Calescibacterium sp.]|nr:hypothetical protein [Candidatus Calescibacterium sp.]MCX7972026.1 hypothetical protein [bacterium]MDW8194690.1 hypothetical protein [Candidatus Calescibacterium sp.]
MSSILTQIFLESLLSLPLPLALEKIKNYEDIDSKDVNIIFVDQLNKEYVEKNYPNEENSLRVVNIKLEKQINIYVAYEINHLIENTRNKGKKKC